MSGITGVVLAAGAGTRYGMPKALVLGVDGRPWVESAIDALATSCDDVVVVLGAEAERARPLVGARATVAVAHDWSAGMSRSLAVGLDAVQGGVAALITLVDLPGLPPDVCDRLVAPAVDAGVLRRAVYAGRPGHPVLIGVDHFPAVHASLTGDRGAGLYLAAHAATPIECGDLFDGLDIDVAGPVAS